MKFNPPNRIALAALFLMGAATMPAHAAPSMPTCDAMNISHNGSRGVSYNLQCQAGSWVIVYTGSVPAGTSKVDAHYKLHAKSESGEHFTLNRVARLPSPSVLGQVLQRETLLLDDGSLALRECESVNCTSYRPMGNSVDMAKATITVTPELERLRAENLSLSQKNHDLVGQVSTKEGQLAEANSRLEEAKSALAAAIAGAESAGVDAAIRVNQVKFELDQLKKSMASQEGLLAQQAVDRIALLEEQLKEMTAQRDAASAALTKAQEKLVASESVAVASPVNADQNSDVLAKQVSAAMQQMADLVQEQQRDLEDSLAREQALQDKYDNLLREHEQLAKDILEALAVRDSMEGMLKNTEANLELANKTVSDLNVKLDASKLTIGLLQQAVFVANSDTDAKQMELIALSERMAKLQSTATSSPAEPSACIDEPAKGSTKVAPQDPQLQTDLALAHRQISAMSHLIDEVGAENARLRDKLKSMTK